LRLGCFGFPITSCEKEKHAQRNKWVKQSAVREGSICHDNIPSQLASSSSGSEVGTKTPQPIWQQMGHGRG
jgi:hypothetical protein